ncbi:PilN domain-containing protein [Paenibacillus sp. strain BS8-2]
MKSINLLPPKPSARGGSKLTLVVALPLIAAAAVLIGMSLLWQKETDRLLLEATHVSLANAKLKAEGVPITELNEQTEMHALIGKLEEQRIEWKTYLDAILEPLSADARIVSLSVGTEGVLHMEVDFTSYERSVDYVEALENVPVLSYVNIQSYNRRADETKSLEPSADGTFISIRGTTYTAILDLGLASSGTQGGGVTNGAGK